MGNRQERVDVRNDLLPDLANATCFSKATVNLLLSVPPLFFEGFRLVAGVAFERYDIVMLALTYHLGCNVVDHARLHTACLAAARDLPTFKTGAERVYEVERVSHAVRCCSSHAANPCLLGGLMATKLSGMCMSGVSVVQYVRPPCGVDAACNTALALPRFVSWCILHA